MRITTTDGQDYTMPDQCSYCNLDTGGNHQPSCPCAELDTLKLQDKLAAIREKSHRELGEAWKRLAR